LAIGRANTVKNMMYKVLKPIGIKDIGAMSGGDSQELNVRPAITYFGAKGFIDNLGIEYTPPTLGE
jgi:hypothetical protein